MRTGEIVDSKMDAATEKAQAAFGAASGSPADWGLRLIRFSCLADFDKSLEWAQWCREVAHAALDCDEEKLQRLERQLTKQEND